MADTKISALTEETALEADDQFVIVTDGTNKRIAASNIDLIGSSIVSGTVTAAGGSATAADGASADAYHFDGGSPSVVSGAVTVAGDTPSTSAYLYINGGNGTFSGGNVTISGAVDSNDCLNGGEFISQGGVVSWASGTPSVANGGRARLIGGGSLSNSGGVVRADGGSLAAGGNVTVDAGDGGNTNSNGGNVIATPGTKNGSGTAGSVQLNGSDGTTKVEVNATGLGFYGTAPIAQQTGVAVTAAAVHAALVNLGLITA